MTKVILYQSNFVQLGGFFLKIPLSMFYPKMYILFWFRKSRTSNEKGSIQCRITINQQTVEIGSTKINVQKNDWDSEKQQITAGYTKERDNRRLRDMASHLDRLHDLLLTQHPHVSPNMVKDQFLGVTKFYYSVNAVLDNFLKHRDKMVIGKLIASTTYGVNENYSRHIKEYLALKKIIQANAVQDDIIDGIFYWLLSTGRMKERTARKVVAYAKQVWKWAKKEKMIAENTLQGIPIPGQDRDDDIDNTHLSITQLINLIRFDFYALIQSGQITTATATTLSEERDAFVFNCFSGMHHCDYTDKSFRIEVFKNSYFLKGHRKKSKKPFTVKLLEPAVIILNRYGGLEGLPIKTNQKRNQTLKLVAMYVGIPLLLTTKIARKTFADLALNEMLMNQDDVAACLGLTSTRYLKHYARTHERRLMKVMKSWTELEKAS